MDNHFEYFWNCSDLSKDYWSIVGMESEELYFSLSKIKYDILKKLGFTPNQKILDVGCGTGILPLAICHEFCGQYVGCDISKKAIDFCKDKYNSKWYSFHIIKNNDISYIGNDFNFIVFYSVFTHLYFDEIQKYLKQSSLMLANNGIICADFFLGETRLENREYSIITYKDLYSLIYEFNLFIRIIKRETTVYKDIKLDRILLEIRK